MATLSFSEIQTSLSKYRITLLFIVTFKFLFPKYYSYAHAPHNLLKRDTNVSLFHSKIYILVVADDAHVHVHVQVEQEHEQHPAA